MRHAANIGMTLKQSRWHRACQEARTAKRREQTPFQRQGRDRGYLAHGDHSVVEFDVTCNGEKLYDFRWFPAELSPEWNLPHPTNMNLELDGKRALVTGSTAGIAYTSPQDLAPEGAVAIVHVQKGRQATHAIQ